MIRSLTGFVAELREIGLPVSMVEVMDAADAIRHVDLSDPDALRGALGATLVKNGRHYRAFDTAFEVYFGLRGPLGGDDEQASDADAAPPGGGGGEGVGDDELLDGLVEALTSGDRDRFLELIRRAVDRLGGIEPGRPVGGRYYYHRVIRRLGAVRLNEALLAAVREQPAEDALLRRLEADKAGRMADEVRDEVRREILRRLIADRGVERVAETMRLPLVEDIDLMHATRDELESIERTIAPLARKLATRLSRRRKHGSKGRLDVRRTIRRSLAHGGALLEPQFKPPRRSKPELVILCDVSGSMATFARFTLQLTHAISSELSKVRSFVFIDGLDEVSDFFRSNADFHESVARVAVEADIVRRDGHSDYGRSLCEFTEKYLDAITPKTTVIVTGDARNNYRETGIGYLEEISGRARSLFWLNPEVHRYWDTGDSVMSVYAAACDTVDQVRTLRQLEAFVERAALPATRPVRRSV